MNLKGYKMRLLFSFPPLLIAGIFLNLNPTIEGKWIENDDTKSMIIITNNRYIEIYARDTVYAGNYHRDVHSCDTAYMKNIGIQKQDFIKVDDGRCFEIVGVTSSRLSLRYTISGKLHAFHKLKSNVK